MAINEGVHELMAKDYQIEQWGDPDEWDLSLGPPNAQGLRDLVVIEGNDEIVQHLTYRLHTWLGESPYDRSAGVPYLDGVFGQAPLEGVAGLFSAHILETDGIAGMDPLQEIDLDGTTIRLEPSVYLDDGTTVSVAVEVSA